MPCSVKVRKRRSGESSAGDVHQLCAVLPQGGALGGRRSGGRERNGQRYRDQQHRADHHAGHGGASHAPARRTADGGPRRHPEAARPPANRRRRPRRPRDTSRAGRCRCPPVGAPGGRSPEHREHGHQRGSGAAGPHGQRTGEHGPEVPEQEGHHRRRARQVDPRQGGQQLAPAPVSVPCSTSASVCASGHTDAQPLRTQRDRAAEHAAPRVGTAATRTAPGSRAVRTATSRPRTAATPATAR